MKKQNTLSTVFFTYFGFGTLLGILFALLTMAISNTYITHHDVKKTQGYSQIYSNK